LIEAAGREVDVGPLLGRPAESRPYDCFGQLKIPLHDVLRSVDRYVAVREQERRLLADSMAIEPVANACAGEPSERRGFHQTLKVDGEIVTAKRAARRGHLGTRRDEVPAPPLHRDRYGGHARDELHHLRVRRLDYPRHPGARLSESDDRRDRVDHIAEGGEAEDENFGRMKDQG
jgi:hypothetical protein